jgi:hypothetical protein
MPNIATTLLDFILDLLRDPQAAQDFQKDPQAALAAAGMGDVSPADVRAAMQMVGDCSPVRNWSDGGADRDGGQHAGHGSGHDPESEGSSPAAAGAPWRPGSGDHPSGGHRPSEGDQGHPGEDHEVAVLQHVEYTATTNVAETNISVTRIDASHSIWAGGDANVLFGDDNVLAEKGGVALSDVRHAGPIDVDNTRTTQTTTISDSNVAGRDQVVDQSHGNTTTTAGDNSQIGDREDNSVHDSGNGNFSGNTDNSVDHSFDGNSYTDESDRSEHTTTVTDSGNGNFSGNTESTDNSDRSDHSDNSTTISHSLNGNEIGNSSEEESTSIDRSTHLDDSLNGNAVGNSYEDESTHVDHSLNGNELGNSYEDNSTNLDDSLNHSLDGNAVAADEAAANSGHADADLTPVS